jgi:hypothetical protein
MDYKYLYDSLMPDCLERSLKKLRCLLRFYIMLITPGTPLLEETWEAIRDMQLALTEEELLGKIKDALSEVKKGSKKAEKGIIASIDSAALKIDRFNSKIGEDR